MESLTQGLLAVIVLLIVFNLLLATGNADRSARQQQLERKLAQQFARLAAVADKDTDGQEPVQAGSAASTLLVLLLLVSFFALVWLSA